MSSGISRDEWLSALQSAGIDDRDDQDAMTPMELGEILGIDRQAAVRRLKKMVKMGKATPTRKRVHDAGGRMQSHTAYRLVDKPKKRR
jgi:hypothetical protein